MALAAAPLAVSAKATDKVAPMFTPARYDEQTVGGVLGFRMQVNREQRLLRVDRKGLIDGFLIRPGSHPWIGEHAGKYLHAASNSWLYSKDVRLKNQMDAMVLQLISAQLADGYLGTYTNDQRWTSWDVWVHKYNLIGLLSYHNATGSQSPLDAATKIGELMVRTFGTGPGQIDISQTGDHLGMASTSILEPMCQLYRETGDVRFLAFAEYIVASWDHPKGPGVLRGIQSTGSVRKTANAKGYEMLSNLVGLLELYRLTGKNEYLSAPQIAWTDITRNRLYITGTTTSKEYFRDDHRLPGSERAEVGEGCVTVTWLQLNWHLLQLTAEQKYADEIEKTVFNHLLAAQDPSNGNICYFTALMGRKQPGPGISCCVSSVPRGISMIPQLAWGQKEDGVAILLYVPGQVTVRGMQIVSETSFPENGNVRLRIGKAPGGNMPVYLRVPAWTANFQASVDGKRYQGTPGEFLRLDRKWKQGDVVMIAMDMTVKMLDGGAEYPGHIALQRGPQVLSLEERLNPNVPYIFRAAPLSTRLERTDVAQFRAAGIVVDRTLQKRDAALTFVPYMDAAQPFVWTKSPDGLSSEPVAATAFGIERWSRNGQEGGSICDERADTYGTTDKRETPANDLFAVTLRAPATVRRLVFRHGKSTAVGGWFENAPTFEVQRAAGGAWERVGPVPRYENGAALAQGQPFELTLAEPLEIAAVRVIGRSHNYASCAELAAYHE